MLAHAAGRMSMAVVAVGFALSSARAESDPAADYPTNARADYVFGCMAANGQTREALERCSCSLDIVASILPYDRYVQAETILRMRQGVGTSFPTRLRGQQQTTRRDRWCHVGDRREPTIA